eukprot:6212517-Pleurochrysis_carterae.AAC.17
MKGARDESLQVNVGRVRGSNCEYLGLLGKTPDNRPRSPYQLSLGYRDITDCDRDMSDDPPMGQWQGFTAVYADGGMYGISLSTRSDVSDWQLCLTWCRLPR